MPHRHIVNPLSSLCLVLLFPLTGHAQDTEPPAAAPAPAAAATSAAPPARAPARAGRVVRRSDRDVVIDLGSDDGLEVGARVEAAPETNLMVDGALAEMPRRSVAVGEVVAVTPDHAQVSFGVNELVQDDAQLRPTDAPRTASLVAPPRVGGVLEFAGSLAPSLTVGDYGGGLMAEASLTYRGEGQYFLRAAAGPSGFTTVSQGTLGFGSAALTGGFDSRFVEVGLGFGVLPYREEEFSCPDTGNCGYTYERSMRAAFALSTRLGAADGFHLRLATTLAATSDAFRLGTLDATLQVPLTTGVWLLARGGTGTDAVGYSYAGASVRWLMRGNGGSGSLLLTSGIEWTLSRVPSTDGYDGYEDMASGIAPTLGIEYRR